MTPQEKAQAGLQLLKQAVKDVIGDGQMQPSDVREALHWPRPASPSGGVIFAVMTVMSDDGELEKGDGNHPKYSAKKSTQS